MQAATAFTRYAKARRDAARHLWMSFAPLGAQAGEVPLIVRGEGCYIFDDHGHRYLDGLSSLFCVNIGHGRSDIAQAGADQAAELGYFNTWSYIHPPAAELAATIAELAPGDLNRVFFTSGGAEAVESALKLARQYHKLTGNPRKTKVVARHTAYHGTTLGALAATGITGLREPFEPLPPGMVHTPNTDVFRLADGADTAFLADAIEERILFEGPDTVAAVILEPVQNAGGCFVPPDGYFQRVRSICDEHNVLLISDEVICSWGRLGTWFGAERFGYQPDLITTAKGLTSGYAPMGAVIASDRIAEPFADHAFLHGFTFSGHPACAAIALANIRALRDERVLEHVRDNTEALRTCLEGLLDIPIVGDVRGDGYFWAIELVSNKHTKGRFTDTQADVLLRGYLSAELWKSGLFCRTDDRGEPVVQLAPPLIAGPEHFKEIVAALRPALEGASERMSKGER